MTKIFTIFFLFFAFNINSRAQITVSSVPSNYDTIFGGTSIYYQFAWDEPLDEGYEEIFKLSKPLKAFETLWDSAMVADGSLWLVSTENPGALLLLDGTGWDLVDQGWENDSLGLNNISPIKISDSMDRVEWRSFGFFNELDSTWQLQSSGSVQIKVNAMNKVDLVYGDFAIVHPDLCFEGYGSLRPTISYSINIDSVGTWYVYGNPESPAIGTRTDTAFDHLPVLGQKITLDFNKTNFIKSVSTLNVKISPNPVANVLNIAGSKDYTGSVFQIISMDGRTVSKGKLGSNELNVEILKTGNYILKISNNKQLYIARFVKE